MSVIEADITLAVLCFLCVLLGIPANLLSLNYFMRKTSNISTCIYIAITTTDFITCFMVLPVGLSLSARRHGMMFSDKIFCSLWGLFWEFIPYYSAFLVFSLSALRTFALIKPFVRIRNKKVVRVLVGYGVFLITRQVLGVGLGYSHYKFQPNTTYCWNQATDTNFQITDAVFSCLQLAFPILPITVSCVTSSLVITLSDKNSQQSLWAMKRKATVTIIIFTLVYLVFHVPVFINYTRFIISLYWTGRFHQGVFFEQYVWLMTYVMTVAVNSLVNPAVYLFRMSRFKTEVFKMVLRKQKETIVRTRHIVGDNSRRQ
ncbi:hypothetical protein ACHWQZ_G004765 [Mnemiopsis leidyi]